MSFDFSAISNLSKIVRRNIILSTTQAKSGHPTSSLSAAEVMTSIFFGGYFKADFNDPNFIHNDRLIFSKGHAAPLLYSLYTVAGLVSVEELMTLRQFSSNLEGHPTMQWKYTEAATGSLGQGLGIAFGMGLFSKKHKIKNKIWVLLGDSEMAEGSVWEAVHSIGYNQLSSVIAIVDMNRLGQRGETMWGRDAESLKAQVASFKWDVFVIEDGHDFQQIQQILEEIKSSKSSKPKMIIAKTKKGHGVSFAEDKEGFHGKAFTKEQAEQAIAEIGEIVQTDPVNLNSNFIASENLQANPQITAQNNPQINNPQNNEQTKTDTKTQANLQTQVTTTNYSKNQEISTRKAYGNGLVQLGKSYPGLVVLDAEMNNSTFSCQFADQFPDRYFEMFIAEQNMVSAATGMARMGAIPFISTFAAFLTRAFDQIRMAAYSEANLKIMGSHAGVSIGPDGTSQMALEDLAMMRSVFNSTVFYPSDAVSTEKLMQIMAAKKGLFYLRATRADLPVLYDLDEKFEIGGSKTLKSSDKDILTIMAAGITLHEGIKAVNALAKKGIFVRLIDMYSIKPLDEKAILLASQQTKGILVVEDHYKQGGLYEAICSSVSSINSSKKIDQNPTHNSSNNQPSQNINCPVYSLCVTKMPHSGTPEELLSYMQIDSDSIQNKVLEIISSLKNS